MKAFSANSVEVSTGNKGFSIGWVLGEVLGKAPVSSILLMHYNFIVSVTSLNMHQQLKSRENEIVPGAEENWNEVVWIFILFFIPPFIAVVSFLRQKSQLLSLKFCRTHVKCFLQGYHYFSEEKFNLR